MFYAQNLTDTPASLSITMLDNCHVSLLAKPCWLNCRCSGCVGAPKQGKTMGIPPRTGFEPSSLALDDTKSRSMGSGFRVPPDFHDITVAPYSNITALEPCKSSVEPLEPRLNVSYLGVLQDNPFVQVFVRLIQTLNRHMVFATFCYPEFPMSTRNTNKSKLI